MAANSDNTDLTEENVANVQPLNEPVNTRVFVDDEYLSLLTNIYKYCMDDPMWGNAKRQRCNEEGKPPPELIPDWISKLKELRAVQKIETRAVMRKDKREKIRPGIVAFYSRPESEITYSDLKDAIGRLFLPELESAAPIEYGGAGKFAGGARRRQTRKLKKRKTQRRRRLSAMRRGVR